MYNKNVLIRMSGEVERDGMLVEHRILELLNDSNMWNVTNSHHDPYRDRGWCPFQKTS